MQRIPAIDPLRAVAALLVLFSHVGFWSGGSGVDGSGRLLARGDSGVAVFFAISALLLLRPWCDAGVRPEPLRRYARKRLARIYPAYALVLACVLVSAGLGGEGLGGGTKILSHAVLAQGLTQDTYRGFTQTWSLTTELTFYALVPVIGRLLHACAVRRRSPLCPLACVATASVLVQGFSASSGIPALGALSTSILAHASWFAVGAGLAWVTSVCPSRLEALTFPRLLALAAVCYLVAATPLGGPIDLAVPTFAQAATKEFLYASLALLLLWAAVRASGTPRVRDLAAAPLASRAGDLSYGIFLWHVLVLQVLFGALHLRLFHAPFVLVLTVTIVATVLLASFSWSVVEKPAIRWGHRRAPAPRG